MIFFEYVNIKNILITNKIKYFFYKSLKTIICRAAFGGNYHEKFATIRVSNVIAL
jgi:hypothetical protein